MVYNPSTWYELNAESYSYLLFDILKKPDIKVGGSSLHRIAASTIGRFGKERIPLLARVLEKGNLETKVAAADALGEVGHPLAITPLKRLLKGSDLKLVLWACLSLSKIGDEAVGVLETALFDAEEWKKFIILDALLKIGTRTVIKPVARVLDSYPYLLRDLLSDNRRCFDKFMSVVREAAICHCENKQYASKIISVFEMGKWIQ